MRFQTPWLPMTIVRSSRDIGHEFRDWQPPAPQNPAPLLATLAYCGDNTLRPLTYYRSFHAGSGTRSGQG
jgi:hypothetical protein